MSDEMRESEAPIIPLDPPVTSSEDEAEQAKQLVAELRLSRLDSSRADELRSLLLSIRQLAIFATRYTHGLCGGGALKERLRAAQSACGDLYRAISED